MAVARPWRQKVDNTLPYDTLGMKIREAKTAARTAQAALLDYHETVEPLGPGLQPDSKREPSEQRGQYYGAPHDERNRFF